MKVKNVVINSLLMFFIGLSSIFAQDLYIMPDSVVIEQGVLKIGHYDFSMEKESKVCVFKVIPSGINMKKTAKEIEIEIDKRRKERFKELNNDSFSKNKTIQVFISRNEYFENIYLVEKKANNLTKKRIYFDDIRIN